MTGGDAGAAPPSGPGGAEDGALDVVVVGGGLAGLTAGLFAARHGWATLVLESTVPGGALINLATIEDFPGFPEGVPGYDLGPIVQEQAEREGARFAVAAVTALGPDTPDAPGAPAGWRVVTTDGSFRAPAVIVAAGSRPRPLGVPGEERLAGRGVSHCATCDGPLFGGREVGVASASGGEGAALHEAMTLAGYAGRVVLFQGGDPQAAPRGLLRRLAERPNVEILPDVTVQEVLGDGALSGVRLRDGASGAESRRDLAALFVYAGREPNTAFLAGRLELAPDGRVPTDAALRTALPGVFAAGDVRADAAGYAVASAGDGAAAAVAAHRYLVERSRA